MEKGIHGMDYTGIPETVLLRALWAHTRPVDRGIAIEAARYGAETDVQIQSGGVV